jgi:hypothetical protein
MMSRTAAAMKALLLLFFLSTCTAARQLREGGLNVQAPGVSATGGNGEPLVVTWPGGGTVVGKTECNSTGVVVAHPAGSTTVDSGGCDKPTTVDVNAAGTSTNVVAEKSKPAASPPSSG